MPIERKRRALILTGAGASIEFGAPSTAELTKFIEGKVRADDWMLHCASDQAYIEIRDTLAGYFKGGAHAVNFEHIYHCAHELLSTFEPVQSAVNEARPVLVPFIERRTKLDETALRALAERMATFIFAELSTVCEHPKTSLAPLTAFPREVAGGPHHPRLHH